jgi:DNA polymerase I
MDITLLIDASNLFYRAYHTNKNIVGRKGVPCGGIYGYICMLDSILTHFKPHTVVCAWDLGQCLRRLKMYPLYKSGRRKDMTPEEKKNIDWQMAQLREILSYTPVRNILLEGIEADDVIGYLAESLKGRKIIISNDHDYIQCIDAATSLFVPRESKLLTENNIDEYLDFDHSRFILWKCLVGDTSDTVKGIHKIGKVRATKIINEGQKLKLAWKDIILRNIKLMTIGLILDKNDKHVIKKQYSSANLKLLENKLTTHLGGLGLLNLLKSRYNWTSSFRYIRRDR